MTTTAIYYQKSDVVQEEFKLIEVATLREMVVEKLQRVIREVKENRRELDDAAILETVTLFNKVREATVDIIRSISIWQESFTKAIRPRLLDCDYIIDRLIYHIDFINATKLRRVLNFQFYRGNFLLLPYPNPKTVEPFRISTALGREIRAFASPPEETVLYCYQFLINCIPDAVYQDRVAPLKRWLMAGWIPRVWVMDVKPTQVAPPKLQKAPSKRQIQGAGAAASNQTSAKDGDASIVIKDSRRSASAAALAGTSDASALKSPNPSPDNKPRQLRRSSTVGSTGSGDRKGEEGQQEGKTRIKRRNQMKEEEAEQLKNMMQQADPNSPSANNNNTSAMDLQELQMQEYLRIQQEKNKNEISRLDTYFQEMELLFLPTLGRRAVQTVVVGGTRVDNNQEYQEPITHDLFHQPDKIVFHHTFKEKQEDLDAIIQDTTIPEQSSRVNAALVTKRNRIMADRGQPTRDRKYANHKPAVDISSYKRKFDRSALLSTQIDVNPMEILFAADNADAESQKDAAAFLKNKYNTGSIRVKSKGSSDGGSEGGGSRRSGRRMSGISLDTSVKSAASASETEGADTTATAATEGPPSTVELVGIATESVGSSSRPSSAMKLPPLSTPPSSSARGKRPGSTKGVPHAASGDSGTGPGAEGTTPGSEADDLGLSENESRRMRRRESRRMSDLTVTFSVNGGEVGAEEFLAMMETPKSANSTGAGATSLQKQRGAPGSPQQRAGLPNPGKRNASPKQKHSSPPRGKMGGPIGANASSPGRTSTSASKLRRPVTPPVDSSDKSRTSASKNDEVNEFGIRKKAGTPPKASLSLTISTSAMRTLFATQEEGDSQSQSTS